MEPFQELEVEIAGWTGLYKPEQVVACSSGTAALHLALEALQLPRGSEVIVPDFTMIACARAVSLAGLTPVFVDCRDDLLMDDGLSLGIATIEPYSAFMAVHVYGRRVDMDWIHSTAGVCHPVIEDLAEAHGVAPHPDTDAACWSFYRNKIIAGEEGGAVAFRDPNHARLARQLRSLGFTDAHDFQHVPRGHNYRMSNAHAALILEKFRYWPDQNTHQYELDVEERREIEVVYDRLCPDEWRMPPRQAPWVYDVRLPDRGDTSCNPDWIRGIVRQLNSKGIAARCAFWPLHLQEEYQECRMAKEGLTPNSLLAACLVLYLPLTPGISTEHAAHSMRRLVELAGG